MSKNKPIELGDRLTRKNLVRNLGHFQTNVDAALASFRDKKNVQRQYANRRWRILNNLDAYLLKFEGRFQDEKNKVLWADSTIDARDAVKEVIALFPNEKILLGKGPELQELELRSFLNSESLDFQEMFLDNQLLNISSEERAHPEIAVLDKSESDLSNMILNKSQLDSVDAFIQNNRKLEGSVLIASPSQLLAEKGSIVFEDEDGLLMKRMANAHAIICLCGIDRIVDSMDSHRVNRDTELMFRTGRASRTYELVTNGKNVRTRFFVVLINNGRTELLKNKNLRNMMLDLEGASLTTSSTLYRHVASNWGSNAFFNPHDNWRIATKKKDFYNADAFADLMSRDPDKSLTGLNEQGIEIELRKRARDRTKGSMGGKVKKKAIMKLGMDRTFLNTGGFGIKNVLYKQIFNREWRKHRNAPRMAKKSFNQLWTSRK